MRYSYKNINIVKEELEKCNFTSKCRLGKKDYIRKRKIGPKDIIYSESGISTGCYDRGNCSSNHSCKM